MKLLPVMLGIWAAALIARVTVFAGGGVGAWVCAVAFWAVSLALLAVSIWHVRRPSEKAKPRYILVILGVLAFSYRVVVPTGITAELSTAIWLAAVIGLLALYSRAIFRHGRHAASS